MRLLISLLFAVLALYVSARNQPKSKSGYIDYTQDFYHKRDFPKGCPKVPEFGQNMNVCPQEGADHFIIGPGGAEIQLGKVINGTLDYTYDCAFTVTAKGMNGERMGLRTEVGCLSIEKDMGDFMKIEYSHSKSTEKDTIFTLNRPVISGECKNNNNQLCRIGGYGDTARVTFHLEPRVMLNASWWKPLGYAVRFYAVELPIERYPEPQN